MQACRPRDLLDINEARLLVLKTVLCTAGGQATAMLDGLLGAALPGGDQ